MRPKFRIHPSTRWALIVVLVVAIAFAGGAASAGAASPVTCNGQVATIVGTDGDDRLMGTDGVDVIAGLGGKDKIYGLSGADIICGGPGRDRIFGGAGHDKIWGNGGNDRINGHAGKDTIHGGNGQDYILGRTGDDKVYGENGHDRLFGGRGQDLLSGGDGNDNITGDLDIDIVKGDIGTDYCDSPNDSITTCELPESSSPRAGVAYEDEMFLLINTERQARGLALLSRHEDLDAYAVGWAEAMSTIPLPLNGSQHHSPAFTCIENCNTSQPCNAAACFQDLPDSVLWTSAFENVGYATVGSTETPADTIDRLFYSPNGFGFMSSPGHKCNIVETAASQVGLGAFVDSSGAVWVVQVFWGTASPLPNPIAECVGIASR